MGDLTKDFSRWELQCRCGCGLFVESDEFLELLQGLRDYMGVPIFPTCGTRCAKHNGELPGASPNSLHLEGRAADIFADGISGCDLYGHADEFLVAHFNDRGGLAYYPHRGHVHIDSRHTRWRDPNRG